MVENQRSSDLLVKQEAAKVLSAHQQSGASQNLETSPAAQQQQTTLRRIPAAACCFLNLVNKH